MGGRGLVALLPSGADELLVVSVPHPAARGSEMQVLTRGGKEGACSMFELNVHEPKYGCWFFGNKVLANSSLVLSTPLDPLFVLLGAFSAAYTKQQSFMPLDGMLELAGGEYAVLLPLLSTLEEQAKCVCETKEAGGDTYYRFSEKRAMAWLTCKVKATAAQLAKEDMYKTSFTPDQLTAYSIDLLSEYVSPDWIEKLKEKHGVKERNEGVMLPAGALMEPGSAEPASKRPRIDPKELARAKAKAAREEKKAEDIKKATKGMKSISSFFGAKPKA